MDLRRQGGATVEMKPPSCIAFIARQAALARLGALAHASLSLVAIQFLAFSLSAATKPDAWSECTPFEQAHHNINPQCTEEERGGNHARLNLPPIEQMHRRYRSAGDIIVGYSKAKDGSGTALVVRRDSHERPLIDVRLRPRKSRQSDVVAVRARIGQDVWNDLVAKGRSLDFTNYAVDLICTAGGTWVVEVLDSDGRVRSVYHDPCYEDEAMRFFDELASAALDALPNCASLKADEDERAEEVLHRCLLPPRKRG